MIWAGTEPKKYLRSEENFNNEIDSTYSAVGFAPSQNNWAILDEGNESFIIANATVFPPDLYAPPDYDRCINNNG